MQQPVMQPVLVDGGGAHGPEATGLRYSMTLASPCIVRIPDSSGRINRSVV